jgi:hypothetical protein
VLSRRFVLGGLLAAPAVVAARHLMPLRGIKYDPMVTLQSWPVGQDAVGEWWRHTGPLSRIDEVMRAMKAHGEVFWGHQETPQYKEISEFGVAHGVNRRDKPSPTIEEAKQHVAKTQASWAERGCIGFSSSGSWFFKKSPFFEGCGTSVEFIDMMEAHHDLATEDLIAWRDKAMKLEDADTRAWAMPMSPRSGDRQRRYSASTELPKEKEWRRVSQEA